MSDSYEGPVRAQPPQRIKPPKEPKRIKTGTWVVICPDDPDMRAFARVEMCLPRARVEVRFRSGATMIVPRSLVEDHVNTKPL